MHARSVCLLAILMAFARPLFGAPPPMEWGVTTLGPTPTTISLSSVYINPVVVCTPNLNNNTAPIVVRVDNVGINSFDAWLQNPGDLTTPVAETVFYIVMEAGSWEINGLNCEAQRYTSTVTDHNGNWNGESQTYLQSYTTPVVMGQVMTANNPEWSVFWCRGSSRSNPPSAADIRIGKHVGEDTNRTRADETVGFIVFEEGNGVFGGNPFDARRSTDFVRGVGSSPPYEPSYGSVFGTPPPFAVGALNAMDGNDGGWLVFYGPTPIDADGTDVAIDEDQIRNAERNHTSEQVAIFAIGGLPALYTDATASTGFSIPQTGGNHDGAGLHWGDIDNDGDLDCIATGLSSSRLASSNAQGLSFTMVTFGGGSKTRQGAFLDIDNDGDLDFYHNDEILYENMLELLGPGTFSDQGDLGFSQPNNSEGVAAADINQDGWCDVLNFANNGNWRGTNDGASPISMTGAAPAGMNASGESGNGDYCSSGDVNKDGRLDFFYHYNDGRLFLSQSDGSFVSSSSGISVVTGNSDKVGSAFADFDNDGDLDLWVSRYDSSNRGYLWRNDAGVFTDITAAAGIDDTTGQRGCAWGDYDNDGDLDLYICTRGNSNDNALYRNNGDGTFTSVNENALAPGDAHDACFVDYDNDGDLDLAITYANQSAVLLENNLDNDQYLKVRVLGAGQNLTNAAAVGTRIELYDSSGTTLLGSREIGVARGYGGIEPMWAHFGGVNPTDIYTLRVHLTGGYVHETLVVPATAVSIVGVTIIPQMVTIDESLFRTSARVVRWREVQPD